MLDPAPLVANAVNRSSRTVLYGLERSDICELDATISLLEYWGF